LITDRNSQNFISLWILIGSSKAFPKQTVLDFVNHRCFQAATTIYIFVILYNIIVQYGIF